MKFDSISETIQRALKSAGLDSRSSLVRGVEATIRQALDSASIAPALKPAGSKPGLKPSPRNPGRVTPTTATTTTPARAPAGSFTSHHFANDAGARDYKIYVPSAPPRRPMPLIVMLHGCKQNPDDFARGTRMNALAEAEGFVVVYPAQAVNANGSNCWNWFSPRDQARDGGEAAIIVGIALQVAETHPIDRRRIFVAGLSAGAAMAVILGQTHPEVFAGVGAHSGLPRGAAHDVATAFSAMHHGGWPSAATASDTAGATGVPTIVFHGDRDATVVARNGWHIVEQSRSAFAAANGSLHMSVEEGRAEGGRAHTTTRFTDASGRARIEHWLIHGGAHAWSGGDPKGSYTAADGPDATAEMVRFFLAQ